ncbi:hypothetical protein [Streptomyces sp. NPDC048277]
MLELDEHQLVVEPGQMPAHYGFDLLVAQDLTKDGFRAVGRDG